MELTIAAAFVILLATFSVMWQMKINRMRDELLEAIRGNREEILENRKAIRGNRRAIQSLTSGLSESERERARLEGFNSGLSESERERARLEGANRVLGDVIRQQSHTRGEGLNMIKNSVAGSGGENGRRRGRARPMRKRYT